jgi:integrase/recombinase XerD
MKSKLPKFHTHLTQKGHTESTVRNIIVEVEMYRNWMKAKNRNIHRAIYIDALDYIKHLKKRSLKPQTINFYLISIKHYYNYLNVKRNPFQALFVKGTKQTVLVDLLSRGELEFLYENYPDNTKIRKRNKVLLGLYVFQGIYSSEAEALQTKDVNLKKGLVTIPASRKRGKRTLKLEPVQMVEMSDYVKTIRLELLKESLNQNVEDRLIIPMYHRDDLLNVRSKLNGHLKLLLPKYKNLGNIRASVIVNWLKEDNVRIVMYKAGHKHVSSTEKYRVNDISKLKEVVLEKHPLG